jgi:hypothetical protein
MNWKRGLGIGLIFIGLYLILIGKMFTGAVIGFNARSSISMVGILVVIAGGILVLSAKTLEKKVEIPRFGSNDDDLIYQAPSSIHPYTQEEIPLEELESIRDNANRRVESGEWIELDAFRIVVSKNQENYPHSTSVMRYWGPEFYKGSSRKKLDDLYKSGKLGKTHELVVGSDIYPRKNLKTKEFEEGPVSLPKEGRSVLHRHWELEQMHDYLKNPRKK